MKPFFQKVNKPWGFEILITQENLPYMGKIAFTKTGHRWSFQYHDKKQESICLFKGNAEIWIEDEKGVVKKEPMKPLQGYYIKPYQKHRFCAISDCWSFESSTPEVGNTIRLEDDYKRDAETEKIRKLPNRGWKGVRGKEK